ncbi:glycosyltransferase family 4 protein [Fictibacillus halophilus]|uniref:glycosyltransferase family 4 protein n=1 Tax=Fictibacillus halophilus TaxID=1610490 RepID=UPI003637D554
MKKKVLFLRSNPIAPDPRVEKEARALHEAGYEVTMLGWDRTCSLSKYEETDYGNIQRLFIPANFGTGLKNLPHLLKWQLGLFKYLLKNKVDIIHSCDFDTIIPAIFVSKIRKTKVVYDIFDFYSDMLRSTPSIVKSFIKKIDYLMINQADALIICDDSRYNQIKGSKPKSTTVIYNSPEETKGMAKLINGMEEEIKGELTVSYVGLLQKERGILEMMEVISNSPNWKMHIAGFGGDEKLIKEKADKHQNIKYHGRVSYKQSLEISNQGDVLFATYDPEIPNHKYSSANKLFEAMMLGKPIIVCKDTGMDSIVEKLNNGVIVDYGNKAQIKSALETLTNNERYDFLSENSRQGYLTTYGWDVMKRKLITLYNSF